MNGINPMVSIPKLLPGVEYVQIDFTIDGPSWKNANDSFMLMAAAPFLVKRASCYC